MLRIRPEDGRFCAAGRRLLAYDSGSFANDKGDLASVGRPGGAVDDSTFRRTQGRREVACDIDHPDTGDTILVRTRRCDARSVRRDRKARVIAGGPELSEHSARPIAPLKR